MKFIDDQIEKTKGFSFAKAFSILTILPFITYLAAFIFFWPLFIIFSLSLKHIYCKNSFDLLCGIEELSYLSFILSSILIYILGLRIIKTIYKNINQKRYLKISLQYLIYTLIVCSPAYYSLYSFMFGRPSWDWIVQWIF